MAGNKLLRGAGIILFHLAILALALFLGKEWSDNSQVVPRALFHLPFQPLDAPSFQQTFVIFLVIHAILYCVSSLFLGASDFKRVRRTMQELFITIAAFTATTLYIFFATNIPFSPDFFLAAGLLFFLFLAVTQIVLDYYRRTRSGPLAWIGGLLSFIKELFKVLITPGGIATLIFAACPLVLMKLYVSNRDVANVVTQIRLYLTMEDYTDWLLVNVSPDLKFRQPIMIQFAPQDDKIAYVLERHGRLYRIDFANNAEKTLMLDFVDRVGEVDMENGALGFDLHPEFGQDGSANGGYVYVYYTDYRDSKQSNRLSRFDLSGGDVATRSQSEFPLIEFTRRSDGYHNGGSVEFGPDGFLYIAIGEASDGKTHQTINRKFHGGIFRIDVNRKGGEVSHPPVTQALETTSQGYYIPNDNPFVGMPGALEEFWALGLRNPFRISFDPKTNDLWVGEVGSTEFEEVNVIEKGHNYQFPYIEGVTGTRYEKPEQIIGIETGPVYFYRHTAYERSVIGGSVYRMDKYPALKDKYLYMDNYSGRIYTLNADPDNPGKPDTLSRSEQVAQRGVTSLIVSPDGEVMITTLGRSEDESGRLLKLVPGTEENQELLAQEQQDQSEMVHDHHHEINIVEIYNTNCARCHGKSGRGDGPDDELLETPLPDFTDPAFHATRSDEHLRAVIHDGGEAHGLSYEMPPWEGILSEEEFKEIIRYLRQFNKEQD